MKFLVVGAAAAGLALGAGLVLVGTATLGGPPLARVPVTATGPTAPPVVSNRLEPARSPAVAASPVLESRPTHAASSADSVPRVAPSPTARLTTVTVPTLKQSPTLAPTGVPPKVVPKPVESTPSGGSPTAIDPRPLALATSPAVVRIATINALGASHTAPGGKSSNRNPAKVRTQALVALIAEENLDIIGFQEFQPSQVRTFRELTNGKWQTRTVGHQTIVWRPDRLELADFASFAIPYFRGQMVKSPGVTLRHRASGELVVVMNVHHPASLPSMGSQARWRQAAKEIEVEILTRSQERGVRTVLLGDMNETKEFYCFLRDRLPEIKMAPEGPTKPGRCIPPSRAPIDWIAAVGDVSLGDYRTRRDDKVRFATDHPINSVNLTLH